VNAPAAAYDALFIIEGLSTEFDLALEGEVHTLAYLAFLLSLSAGRDPEQWGYSFVADPTATPFSADLDDAIQSLARLGLLGAEGSRLTAARSAAPALRAWNSLPGHSRRRPFLRAALAAATSLSLPTLVRSVHREPQLARAEALGTSRALPEKLGLLDLLADLEQVDEVLAEQGLKPTAKSREAQLSSRARLWLSYLASETPDSSSAEASPSPA
jgi:hypothetical protein